MLKLLILIDNGIRILDELIDFNTDIQIKINIEEFQKRDDK